MEIYSTKMHALEKRNSLKPMIPFEESRKRGAKWTQSKQKNDVMKNVNE